MAIISICGDKEESVLIKSIYRRLTELGKIVLYPNITDIEHYTYKKVYDEDLLMWKGITFEQLNNIKTSDVVFVINPNGRLGVQSTIELGYATCLGKLIIAMQHDSIELGRESLFDIVIECEKEDEAIDALLKIL